MTQATPDSGSRSPSRLSRVFSRLSSLYSPALEDTSDQRNIYAIRMYAGMCVFLLLTQTLLIIAIATSLFRIRELLQALP